jgi:hypothetical protein
MALTMLVVAAPFSAIAALAAPPPPPAAPSSAYRVPGVDQASARAVVTRQGVEVLGGGRDHLEIQATPAQAERLRASGLRLVPLPSEVVPPLPVAPGEFPRGVARCCW